MKKNEFKYIIFYILYNVLVYLVIGTIYQTFLLESGIAAENVTTHVSMMQVVTIISILSISVGVDKIKNIPKTAGIVWLTAIPTLLLMLVLCKVRDMSEMRMLLLFYVTGIIANTGNGLSSVLANKLPYQIMDMKEYDGILGKCNASFGIVIFLFSAGVSAASAAFGYFEAMQWFVLTGIIFNIAMIVNLFTFRTIKREQTATEEEETRSILTYKPFWLLHLPNFLIGFVTGVFGIMPAIGYHLGIIDTNSSSLLVVVQTASTIIAGMLFTYLSKKQMNKRILIYSSVILTIAGTVMCLQRTTFGFLVGYTIAYLAYLDFTLGYNVAVVRIVDYEVFGRCISWKLVLNTAGAVLAGLVSLPLIDTIGPVLTLLFVGVLEIAAGVILYLLMARKEKCLQI